MIDLDTVASAGSWEAALHSAGGAVHATERLLAGGGFRVLRPAAAGPPRRAGPGHGLLPVQQLAVAAAHAIAECGVERVLVLDWDVHHGNGTEAIFYGSSEVLYASIHQSPLYPGTGAATDFGSGEGEGYTPTCRYRRAAAPTSSSPWSSTWSRRSPGNSGPACSASRPATTPIARTPWPTASWVRPASDMAATMRDLAGSSRRRCSSAGGRLLTGGSVASVVATLEGMSGDGSPREAQPPPAARRTGSASPASGAFSRSPRVGRVMR